MDQDAHAMIAMLARDLLRGYERRLEEQAAEDPKTDFWSVVRSHQDYEAARTTQGQALVAAIMQHRPRDLIFIDGTGSDITGEVTDLLVANGGWLEGNEQRASLFLMSGRAEAQRIGWALDKLGGMASMLAVHHLMTIALNSIAARELSAAWNGVGQWID